MKKISAYNNVHILYSVKSTSSSVLDVYVMEWLCDFEEGEGDDDYKDGAGALFV